MKSPITVPRKHLETIKIWGLSGRSVHIPGSKEKIIIYIHGLHTSAERHYSLCEFLSDFGEVYAPDLPGFGGMDSFYKIGKEPTYDNYTDYLFEFIKSIKKENDPKLVIVGLSFGSQIMTRLFQKYPKLADRTSLSIALAGIGSNRDLNPLIALRTFMWPLLTFGSMKYPSKVIDLMVFNPVSFRLILAVMNQINPKLRRDKTNRSSDIIAMEYNLWRQEDFRTHMATAKMMTKVDLRDFDADKIDLTLNNVAVEDDQYINRKAAAKTFKDLYKDYQEVTLKMGAHAPSLIANKDAVSVIFPMEIRELLKR